MNIESYGRFADVYDLLMRDVDYKAWAIYIEGILKSEGLTSGSIIDCGCGTGTLSLLLQAQGYRVTGLDASSDMLEIAQQKARSSGLTIPFVQQDMRGIRMHKAVDAIVSTCDGVNYLTDIEDVSRFFSSAYRSLRGGGLLLFDISSYYKLSTILGNNTEVCDDDECAFIWQNSFDEDLKMLEMRIDFFEKQKNGLYERFFEEHIQRAHTEEELRTALIGAGFSSIKAYNCFTFDSPNSDASRIQFVAIKEQ